MLHIQEEFTKRNIQARGLRPFSDALPQRLGLSFSIAEHAPIHAAGTVLEDEALNAELSPTVLTAYLKKRLGYGEKSEATTSAECGQLRLVFEHDILEDGV